MNNRKFIYGLVAFTIMSCQSTPNTINQEAKKDIKQGSFVDKKHMLNNDDLKFGVLNWSEINDCYNSGGELSYDWTPNFRLDDCSTRDFGLYGGWSQCYDPINVVCKLPDNGDDNGSSNNSPYITDTEYYPYGKDVNYNSIKFSTKSNTDSCQ